MSSIDLSGLTSIYSDYASQQASEAQSNRLKKVASNASSSEATDDELMDACKQFESYFLEQVFKEMWKTVDTSTTSDKPTSNMVDYFKDATIQKLAAQSTETNSLGLAQTLYEQMKRNIEG